MGYDYFSIGSANITYKNIKKHAELVEKINSIKYFSDLFEPFRVDPKIKEKNGYEFYCKDDTTLKIEPIKKIIDKMVKLCQEYEAELNMNVIIDDGIYLLYWIIKKSIFCGDLSEKIDEFIKLERKKLIYKHFDKK